jgi:hypothetical protein
VISPGDLYVAVITLLLLVALGAAIPVLKGIVLDGIERQRASEATEPSESEDGDGSSPTESDRPHAICSNCETPNDRAFSYCRECGERL